MALPRFCDDCQTLLDDIDPGSRVSTCPSCSKPHMIDERDRTVMILSNSNNKERSLTQQELYNLHGLPTTSRIKKDCPSCGYDTASVVHDTVYEFSICCIKCGEKF
jgi:DNA-directed RNA polymerase subunit M/transcription elongation factor TFIIS